MKSTRDVVETAIDMRKRPGTWGAQIAEAQRKERARQKRKARKPAFWCGCCDYACWRWW